MLGDLAAWWLLSYVVFIGLLIIVSAVRGTGWRVMLGTGLFVLACVALGAGFVWALMRVTG